MITNIKKIAMITLMIVITSITTRPIAHEGFHARSLIAQARVMETQLRHLNRVFEDSRIHDYLNQILQRVATREEIVTRDLRVIVLRDRRVNAVAAPDGAIYVTTGLLARLVNETQAAALIAHEVGHVIKEHTGRRLVAMREDAASGRSSRGSSQRTSSQNRSRANVENQILHPDCGTTAECRAAYADIFRGVIGVSERVFKEEIHIYSLEFEVEADSVGLARLRGAGYSLEIADEPLDLMFMSVVLWNVILYEAGYAISRGDFELAEILLDRLVSVGTCDAAVFAMRGDLERLLAPRSAASFEWYNRSLECDPQNAAPLASLGLANFAVGRRHRACEFLGRYIEQSQNSVIAGFVNEILNECVE